MCPNCTEFDTAHPWVSRYTKCGVDPSGCQGTWRISRQRERFFALLYIIFCIDYHLQTLMADTVDERTKHVIGVVGFFLAFQKKSLF